MTNRETFTVTDMGAKAPADARFYFDGAFGATPEEAVIEALVCDGADVQDALGRAGDATIDVRGAA